MERPRVTIGALVFNEKGEILLLKSQKWHGKYTVPCGHVEFGELLKDAVKREVKEETALDVGDIHFLELLERIHSDEYYEKNRHFVCINFRCNKLGGEVKLNDEAEDFIWVLPENSIEENLDSITKQTIKTFLERKD